MITLFCGGGAAEARRQLLKAGLSTLVVVPDKLTGANLAAKLITGAVNHPAQVLDFEAFIAKITRGGGEWPESVVPESVSRAIIRNIIDSVPGDFDHLVGRYSVPRMTQGVLSRILAAIEAMANVVETEDAASGESQRRKQLRLLLRRFEERLTEADMQREKLAIWQHIIDLTSEAWTAQFPETHSVVFADFDIFADEVFLAIAAVSKQVETCNVLLEFDPEDDRHTGSQLDSAYQRLYDMADRVIREPEGLAADTDAGEGPGGSLPAVISVESVAQEVRGIAGAIRAKFTSGGAVLPSVVIAVPDNQTYAAALEKGLQDYGLKGEWIDPEPLDSGPEFLLLERLRQCAGRFVTGSAVADLFRAPGFSTMVGDDLLDPVDAWNLASRLDYVLALTGQVTGWKNIMKQVSGTLSNLQNQRRRSNQPNSEELLLDERLLAILNKTHQAVEPFLATESVVDWTGDAAKVVGIFRHDRGLSGAQSKLPLRNEALQQALLDLGRAGEAISSKEITFGYFMALLKTVVYHARVDIDRIPNAGEVFLCSPETAAKMSADICIVAGFNDGSFPRFSRPDASFSGYDNLSDQRPARARQWLHLERLIDRYKNLWLWMPERQGTEDLLPSQFAEALVNCGRARLLASSDFLYSLSASAQGIVEKAEAQFAAYLKNMCLSPAELAKFRKYGLSTFNTARAISVLAERRNPELGGYDGIIKDPGLQKWLAAWLDRHTFSVSQLDGIVGCSFRFFAERMLHLDEVEEADDLLPATVFGSFAHDVLARFYRSWVAAGRGVLRSTDESLAREELLRAYNAEYDPSDELSEFARDLMNLKLFGELGPESFGETDRPLEELADAGVFGKFLLMEMQRGDDPAMDFLHPSNFEVGFGVAAAEEEDPLSTTECVVMDVGDGESVRLWGRIDRIDVSDTGVFAVTDYKTGHLPKAVEIAGGFRTQLPVYMLVAQELLKKKYDSPDPAGGLYYSLKRGKAARVSGAFVRAVYQQQVGVSGRCMKDEQFVATLAMVKGRIRDSMTALRRGYLTTTRHDPKTICQFCEFQRMCYRDVERTVAFWERIEEMNNQQADAGADQK